MRSWARKPFETRSHTPIEAIASQPSAGHAISPALRQGPANSRNRSDPSGLCATKATRRAAGRQNGASRISARATPRPIIMNAMPRSANDAMSMVAMARTRRQKSRGQILCDRTRRVAHIASLPPAGLRREDNGFCIFMTSMTGCPTDGLGGSGGTGETPSQLSRHFWQITHVFERQSRSPLEALLGCYLFAPGLVCVAGND
jgi:hypothetical protein